MGTRAAAFSLLLLLLFYLSCQTNQTNQLFILAFPTTRRPKEPFHKTERRDWAETVLDNPELLMMYAQSSGDVSFPPFPYRPIPYAIFFI